MTDLLYSFVLKRSRLAYISGDRTDLLSNATNRADLLTNDRNRTDLLSNGRNRADLLMISNGATDETAFQQSNTCPTENKTRDNLLYHTDTHLRVDSLHCKKLLQKIL